MKINELSVYSVTENMGNKVARDTQSSTPSTDGHLPNFSQFTPDDVLNFITDPSDNSDLRDLPPEVWQKILSYVKLVDTLKTISSVSKYFYDLVNIKLWTISRIRKIRSVLELDYLSHLPIRHLDLYKCKYSDELFRVMIQFSSLHSVILGRDIVQHLKPGQMFAISHLPLQELSLAACNVHDHHISAALIGLNNLRKLDISNNSGHITDKGMQHISSLNKLQYLDISWSESITSTGLQHIAGLRRLQYLDITRCPKITPRGIQAISHLPIKELHVYSSGVDDSYLTAISTIATLRKLSISNDVADNDPISETGMERIAALPQLQYLDVRQCWHISPSGVKALSHLTCTILTPSSTSLVVWQTPLSVEAYNNIEQLFP